MPDTNKHTPHENDILTVKNIDVDCEIIDTEENYPHKDYFQVKWSGHPHRIPPGETRKMPRFLAEHYAKHLADHVLMRLEEKTGRKGLVQSSFERPRVLSEILLGVDTYFLGEDTAEEGQQVANKVSELNPEERFLDLGTIPNPAVGVLKDEPKAVVLPPEEIKPEKKVELPVVSNEKTSIYDESKPKPSMRSLLADCEKLGIEVTGKESTDQLISKIKAF